MYIPPYKSLLDACNAFRGKKATPDSVTLTRPLFDLFVQLALQSCDFDEKRYLEANPDVRKDLAEKGELTALQHFLGYGYFEGRSGALPKVDEAWYLRTYKDVAEAVAKGSVASASEHFHIIGAAEGRAPSKAYVDVAEQWKILLAR